MLERYIRKTPSLNEKESLEIKTSKAKTKKKGANFSNRPFADLLTDDSKNGAEKNAEKNVAPGLFGDDDISKEKGK